VSSSVQYSDPALPDEGHVFSAAKRVTVPASIYGQIVDAIRQGHFQAGDRLQSERELMRQFGASRASVREALRALTMARIIDVQHGKGAFVNRVSTAELLDRQTLAVLLEKQSLQDLGEARLVLEVGAARIVASRATTDDLAALESHVNSMDDAAEARDAHQFARADFAFHESLLKATRNGALVGMHEVFHDLLIRALDRSVKDVGVLPLAALNHRRIFEAIANKDEMQAAHLMGAKLRASMALIGASFEAESTKQPTDIPSVDAGGAKPTIT